MIHHHSEGLVIQALFGVGAIGPLVEQDNKTHLVEYIDLEVFNPSATRFNRNRSGQIR